jgi:hypothetical protein
MQKNVGPMAIGGAVVALVILMVVLYNMWFAPKGPDPALAAPEHKDMAEFYRNQGRVKPAKP